MKSPRNPGKPGVNASAANVGKALDALKVAASTIGDIASVFAEEERTQQVLADANSQVRQAEEKTKQVEKQINAEIARIDVQVHKHNLKHVETMQRMSDAHAKEMRLHGQRERVLDKLLESPHGHPEQLVDGLRVLLPDNRR